MNERDVSHFALLIKINFKSNREYVLDALE